MYHTNNYLFLPEEVKRAHRERCPLKVVSRALYAGARLLQCFSPLFVPQEHDGSNLIM